MSAIAKSYQLVTGDFYLAGIWKRDIHRGLLWQCTPKHPGAISRNPGAPFWSWASIFHDSVDFDPSVVSNTSTLVVRKQDDQRDAILIKEELVPLLGDPYGQLSSAALHIRGLMHAVGLQGNSDMGHIITPRETLCLDEPASGLTGWADLDPDTVNEENERRQQGRAEPRKYVALFLARWDVLHDALSAHLRGLLLAPTGADRQFVRKGIWDLQPGMRTAEGLARVKVNPFGKPYVDPRKNTFEGTWDGWTERTVVLV